MFIVVFNNLYKENNYNYSTIITKENNNDTYNNNTKDGDNKALHAFVELRCRKLSLSHFRRKQRDKRRQQDNDAVEQHR